SRVDSVWHRAKDRADASQASKRSPIGDPPHLGTSAATARSAKAEIAESEYCSRFPIVNFIAMVMVTIPFGSKAVGAFRQPAEIVTRAVTRKAPRRKPIVVSHDAPDV